VDTWNQLMDGFGTALTPTHLLLAAVGVLLGTFIGVLPGIGPAMAVAILATLYGAVLANMVLLPLAAKLDRNNQAEALVANLTIMTAVSIAGHDSPRRLEVMLNSILPPAERIVYFD